MKKQNKDREELRKQIESLVTLYFGEPCIAVEDSLVDWIETHTQKKVEEKIERVKGLKVGEAEGWDFFFGSKKQCCPGDDYSDIYNQAISDVLNIMEEK